MRPPCPSQQPTVLFSIYQNNTLTIRCLVDETIDPVTQCIILKIVGFMFLGTYTFVWCVSKFEKQLHLRFKLPIIPVGPRPIRPGC